MSHKPYAVIIVLLLLYAGGDIFFEHNPSLGNSTRKTKLSPTELANELRTLKRGDFVEITGINDLTDRIGYVTHVHPEGTEIGIRSFPGTEMKVFEIPAFSRKIKRTIPDDHEDWEKFARRYLKSV